MRRSGDGRAESYSSFSCFGYFAEVSPQQRLKLLGKMYDTLEKNKKQ